MRRLVLIVILATACDAPSPDDAGARDAGRNADAREVDAPSPMSDGGDDDGGEIRDAPRTDAPRADAGTGDEVVGTVGPYAGFHLGDHPIYSIDMAEHDYAIHFNGDGVGTGTSTHHDDGWWDGGAFSRMTPPTVDGLERGIAVNDVWRGATIAIQEVNLRFEWRGSSRLGSLWDGAKFLISHWRETLEPGDAQTRPMLFAAQMRASDDPDLNRDATLSFAPAQGTTQAWGDDGYFDAYPPLAFWPGNVQAFYVADDDDLGDGTFAERPLFGGSEVITFELRLISVATDEHPRGLIGMRVYRRNGEVFERSAPWDIDDAEALGDYFSEIQQFGCGQYNTAPTPDPDLYFDVGGYITLARDFGGWMGPRHGFVE